MYVSCCKTGPWWDAHAGRRAQRCCGFRGDVRSRQILVDNLETFSGPQMADAEMMSHPNNLVPPTNRYSVITVGVNGEDHASCYVLCSMLDRRRPS